MVAFGGLASLAAGAVHAAAAGIHAEHRQLAQIFIVVAVLQMGTGLWALTRATRWAAWSVVVVNVIAVAGWLATRMFGIGWIDGLEVREAPQFADTACAALGLVAIVAANAGVFLPAERQHRAALMAPAVVLGVVAVSAMLVAGTHVHSHDESDHGADAAGGHSHGAEVVGGEAGVVGASGAVDEPAPHGHGDDAPAQHPGRPPMATTTARRQRSHGRARGIRPTRSTCPGWRGSASSRSSAPSR